MTVRWRAPGRVNLIGEHTDYNGGFVLPFALDMGCTATVARRDDAQVVLRSAQMPDDVSLALDDLEPGTGGWAAYVAGVVWALRTGGDGRAAHELGGLDIAIDSDVPGGAGLSSSAAVVCSVVTAVDDLFELGLGADELLAVSRSAENDYVGAPTGGMDQLASLRCTEGSALFCDMRSLTTEAVPFDLAGAGLSVLVIDTRTVHQHSDGEYRRRREGCERAAGLLGVASLRDIAIEHLDDALARLPDDELRRYVRHVVTEDDRVLRTVELLRAGRVREIGPAMTASHASMREDYRITTPELDHAVEALVGAGAHGARMTGGGFGGCAIALVDDAQLDAAVAAVERDFAHHGFSRPGHFAVRPAEGAHRL